MLKSWPVILGLAVAGLALIGVWLTLDTTPDGVTPQSGESGTVTAILALAGAITTLGTSIFGFLTRLTEHRKASLDIERMKLELEEKRRAMDEA